MIPLLSLASLLFLILMLSIKIIVLERRIFNVEGEYHLISTNQQQFKEKYDNLLYQDHLNVLQKIEIEESKNLLEEEYQRLKSGGTTEITEQVDEVYNLYKDAVSKISRNNGAGLDTQEISNKFSAWGTKFLNQEFVALKTEISETNTDLDSRYRNYLATLPPPTTPAGTKGYSYQNVVTNRGTFGVHLIKLPLSEVSVKTVTANNETCINDCPTKPLAQYAQENGAYAGMNGSYFCPPDYSSCAGKVNSFDFAVYNSSVGRWLNENALGWNKTGLVTFSGGWPTFYERSTDYGGGGVSAGISNYPSLLKGGNIVVNDGNLTSYQKDVKGPRGVVGADGTNIYLAIVTGATVTDAAYAMQALGAQDALNLDGGGSSAMYIGGSYKVGPRRSLPNAVLLMK